MTSSELTDAATESAPAQEAATQGRERRSIARFRRRRLFRVGIQSKLLMTLLICSIFSVAVVGLIGAITGRNALRQVEAERLIELRESQKRQLDALFKQMTNSLIVYSGGFSVVWVMVAVQPGTGCTRTEVIGWSVGMVVSSLIVPAVSDSFGTRIWTTA